MAYHRPYAAACSSAAALRPAVRNDMNTAKSRATSLSTVLGIVLWLGNAQPAHAEDDGSTAAVTSSKGFTEKVSNFAFSDDEQVIRLGVPALTVECGQLKGQSVPKEVRRIIPLRSVKHIRMVGTGEARISPLNGPEFSVRCGRFGITGTRMLGGVASDDFSIVSTDLKDVTFTWRGASSSQPVAWPPDSAKYSRGKIVIGNTPILLDKMLLCYTGSEASCLVDGELCMGPGMCTFPRRIRVVQHIADKLKIGRDQGEAEVDLAGARSIEISSYPQASVLLRAGGRTEGKLIFDDGVQGVVAPDSEGWVFIPLQIVKRLEFE